MQISFRVKEDMSWNVVGSNSGAGKFFRSLKQVESLYIPFLSTCSVPNTRIQSRIITLLGMFCVDRRVSTATSIWVRGGQWFFHYFFSISALTSATSGAARIFAYPLLPQCQDSNPSQICTRLGPLKDAIPTELQRRGRS